MVAGIQVVRKPVQRVSSAASEAVVLREGSTGMAVTRLDRVWAVAATEVLAQPRTGLHLVPATAGKAQPPAATAPEVKPAIELAFYRKYTEGLLHRYTTMKFETARVPSLMGRDMFRGKVTHYKVRGFDDVVIFCCDMEKCLDRLNGLDRQLIQRIAIQGYSQGDVAGMVGVSLRSVYTKYGTALDRLTRMLMDAQILEPQKFCQ